MKQELEELEFYICLEKKDGNEFPSWFQGDKRFIKIPLNKRVPNSSIFDLEDMYIGQDENYIYTLSNAVITEEVTDDDNFLLFLIVNYLVKPSRKKKLHNRVKQKVFQYEILCPIWQ